MKSILVTGGAGFIGSNFVIYMLKQYEGYKVLNLDKLTYAGDLSNLKAVENNKDYEFIYGDICDRSLVEALFASHDIDCVVNFAAESHVDRSISDPEVFVRTNVSGTSNLLNVAKKYWLDQSSNDDHSRRKFLQVSTDEVYGSLGDTGLFTETTPLDPHSPYSASKAGSDMLVKAYHDTYGMPVNITRCSNNYGPHQYPEKLIPLMIHNAFKRKPLPVYGDGLNIRDWLYVEDHCRAIDLVLHKGENGEVYNIGGNNEIANIDMIRRIIGYMNKKVDKDIDESLIKYVEDRKGHDRRYGIDSGKIHRKLGWKPNTEFSAGLNRTIDWYLDNVL